MLFTTYRLLGCFATTTFLENEDTRSFSRAALFANTTSLENKHMGSFSRLLFATTTTTILINDHTRSIQGGIYTTHHYIPYRYPVFPHCGHSDCFGTFLG